MTGTAARRSPPIARLPRLRLTATEERDLARAALCGDRGAINALVRSQVWLIEALASRFLRPRITFEELVSEGLYRLFRVIPRFDPDRGYRLTAFVRPHILGALSRYAVRNASVVSGPHRRTGRDISLDAPIDGDTEAARLDALASDLPDPAETAEESELMALVREAIAQNLTPSERTVVDAMRPADELSGELGVSACRIQQIRSVALEKLRWSLARSGVER